MVSKPVAETNFKETENLQPIMLRYKGAPITDTGILHFPKEMIGGTAK